MTSSARVVCWQNREEWLHVYKALYSFNEPDIQKKGVDRVAAWRSRSAGKLPLAIECTANLVSAQLVLDNVGEVQGRLTLAMAIVRFVNGMADQVQKGKFARSVQSIADEIGLPDWLVDLRHEATHASLPSMETLQSGLHVSLSWLQEEYWQAQINMHKENEEKLSQLMKEYRDVALSQVSSRPQKTAKLKISVKKMKEISDEITNVVSISNLWSLLPTILSHEGMMIPSFEQLNILGVRWMSENSSSGSSIHDVPKEIIKMWKPLLETMDISSSQFIISLVIHLLETLSDVYESQIQAISHGYAAWIKYLLQEQSKKNPSLLLRCDFPWAIVLQVTLENPTVYSLELIPLILENLPSISRNMKEKIQQLISMFVNLQCGQLDDMEESLPSDLEQWLANRKNTSAMLQLSESKKGNPPAGLGWQVSQGSTQWHLIPFGEVLGTSDTSPKNLELSQTSGDRFCIESGTEHASRIENDEVIAGYSEETMDYESDNDDDMSSDHNSDQSGCSTQDSEPVEIIMGASHELTELCHTEAPEEENDVTSISDQIYLF